MRHEGANGISWYASHKELAGLSWEIPMASFPARPYHPPVNSRNASQATGHPTGDAGPQLRRTQLDDCLASIVPTSSLCSLSPA